MLFLFNGLAGLILGLMFFKIKEAAKEKKYIKAAGIFFAGVIAFVVVVALKAEFSMHNK